MSNKVITVRGKEYILTHVAQPRVNGGKCNQYEVRVEFEGEAAYYQFADIYVPMGRSVADHLAWWLDDADTRSFAEWSRPPCDYAA